MGFYADFSSQSGVKILSAMARMEGKRPFFEVAGIDSRRRDSLSSTSLLDCAPAGGNFLYKARTSWEGLNWSLGGTECMLSHPSQSAKDGAPSSIHSP